MICLDRFKADCYQPQKVECVVCELPKGETAKWVEKAAENGIKDVWLHMKSETPEVMDIAKKFGINLRTGTCAVMYVTPGFTYHSIHKGIAKLIGQY